MKLPGLGGQDAHPKAAARKVGKKPRLHNIDPQAYLTDVITRIVGGHPQSQIDQLMPWNYAQTADVV